MSMRSFPIVLFSLILVTSCVTVDNSVYEEHLKKMDAALEMADEYVRVKEQRISTIENLLHSRGVTKLQKYHVYGQLYQEYFTFQFDKAKEALDNQILLAEELGEGDLREDAMLKKALLLTNAGFFHEASCIFDNLDTLALNQGQMVEWYNARQKFLYDYQEYLRTSDFVIRDADKIKLYQDKVLSSTPSSSVLNRHMRIRRMLEEQEYGKAYEENLRFIMSLNPDDHDYAVQTYWQGFICENLDRPAEMIKWWVESAICDVRGAVKDNASLCSIAVNLTGPADTERAFRYIRISLDDAVFYNAKLRKVQIASTMPWIETEYVAGKERQYKERNGYLLFTIMIALLFMTICIYTIGLYVRGTRSAKVIEKKNLQLAEYTRSIIDVEENLRKTNLDLVEANAAKEEYLGLFLSMCSGYLDKLKKTLPREQYEAELKNFYKTFDTSFLQLYPSFVEDFNALLHEDCRLIPKGGELLNTELRIFALIKLGITQSSHIASLLRYSVNTIYNYRAQVKNSVLKDRENFEEIVRKIGSRY